MSRAEKIAYGFDWLAPFYDGMARIVYGNALRKAQTCFLSSIPPDAEVLVVGGGSGWFLEQLLLVCNPKFVLYVELSPRMLLLARGRVLKNCPQHAHHVEFIEGNAEAISEVAAYDVVVTHCLLDMFQGLQLRALIARLKDSLHQDGIWYFSDFRKATRFPMSWISRKLIWIMYRFFRIVCSIPAAELPAFDEAFEAAGLKVARGQRFFGGMIEAKTLVKC